ncbi:MAG: glucoamylase family protein, partial [Gemmatimonas sp.]
RAMWPATAIVVVTLAMVAVRWKGVPVDMEWQLLVAVVPFAALWFASPVIAHELSVPAVRRVRRLSQHRRQEALRYAGAHWQFFEHFVSEETKWLAPDNFQEDPAPVVAMRTSPTNIGLQLLSTVSACDLGFITTTRMVELLEHTFVTLAGMRRFRGHFYNWYDLHDLRVLEPAYISTVDSGNLAGHLIAVRQACLHMAETLSRDDALSSRLDTLARHAGTYAEEMDFRFLFDDDRELFSIGYVEATATLDPSSYDLLASESRLASFVAIARDQVPVDHWFRLGRTLTRAGGDTALVSWSGSMFEYLMPLLVMRAYPLTVLDQSCRGAVQRQIAYAVGRGVPWGVSESAYNLRDRHQTYQYRAFGVPDLALKRGLGRDLVIAPYASALAAMVDSGEAIDNLGALERKGALGPYGFRDAVDYSRPLPGARFAVVRNYMAHHVGMSLVALTNVLTENLWQRRFHNDPLVRAAELLLHERIPRRLVFQQAQAADIDDATPAAELERPAVRQFESPDTAQPRVALLGHLPYTVMVNNRGSGYSHFESLAVSRWRADSTTDDTGQFCYVRDATTHRVWSAAHQPTCAPADWYRAHFATDRVTFHRLDGSVETRTEIAVVPADAAEVRRVTVINRGNDTREVELTSYGEIVLATPDADRAHPAFSNLFVQTEWHEWCSAVFATRRPRSSKETPVWLVHVIAVDGALVEPVSFDTDRASFIGRGRSVRNPAALDEAADRRLAGKTGAVLDPIFSLRARLSLEPGQSATVAFTTLVTTTRDRAFELADRYDDPSAAQRALDLAWTTAQVELRELDIKPADAAVFQDFAGHLLYADRALGAPAAERERNRGSQPLLWSLGISGDLPILLANIDSPNGLPTLRQLLSAHRYWRRRGLMTDLVVLDTHPPTYLQDHFDRITAAVRTSSEAALLDQHGGVFVRRAEQLTPETSLMLRATARVHVNCDGRSLARLLERLAGEDIAVAVPEPAVSPPRRMERSTPPMVRTLRRFTSRLLDAPAPVTQSNSMNDAPPRPEESAAPIRGTDRSATMPGHASAAPLLLDNGTGGLTADNDYQIGLRGDSLPPAPWANVVANARGGFVVTERGGGFTWAENSYFYRLTPWHNDPVSDPIGEIFYLQDDETGELWSATPAPVRHESPYVVCHSAGTSTFEHEHAEIATHLTLGVAPDDPVKLSMLRLS